MAQRRTSKIWNYFSVEREHDVKAQCNHCSVKLVRGSDVRAFGTSSLLNHLRTKHPDMYRQLEEDKAAALGQSDGPPTKKSKMASETSTMERSRSLQRDSDRARSIDKAIACMIALDEQPFTVVESPGFSYFMSVVEPRYQMRSRQFYADTVVPEVYDNLQKKMVDRLSAAEFVSLTADEWTCEYTATSYMIVRAHWLDDCYCRQSALIALVHITESETVENLSREFLRVLEQWRIPLAKVHLVLRDNGRNISEAVKEPAVATITCLAHTLQLVIKDALFVQKSVEDVLSIARSVVGHFKHSSTAEERLHDLQRTLKLPEHQLVQDVPTKWNSSYMMLLRFVEQRDTLVVYAEKHDIRMLTEEQWTTAENICTVLKYFDTETRRLSGETACVSDVIPTTTILLHVLRSLKPPRLRTLGNALLSAMESRCKVFEESTECLLATILDPRYKAEYFITASVKRHAEQLLRDASCNNDPHPSNGDTTDMTENDREDETDPWESFWRLKKAAVVIGKLSDVLAKM